MSHWTDRFSLTGRKALITGASKGIGAEIAEVFAEDAALFLASSASDMVNGDLLMVEGGFTSV